MQVPSGKPVTDAIILPPKLEMPMADMASMTTKVSTATPDGKGAYAFTADLIAIAKAMNPELQVMALEAEAAAARVDGAGCLMDPKIQNL